MINGIINYVRNEKFSSNTFLFLVSLIFPIRNMCQRVAIDHFAILIQCEVSSAYTSFHTILCTEIFMSITYENSKSFSSFWYKTHSMSFSEWKRICSFFIMISFCDDSINSIFFISNTRNVRVESGWCDRFSTKNSCDFI